MNICGGPNSISVFNNDHSLGTFTMKRAYWQPRGMPLFTHSDGEHVMQPVKESWENFNPKEFEETVCAGGANGVSSHAPEHMLGNGVQTFGRGIDSDKPDEENLADKPPVNTVAETWVNYMPESVLNEQDQNPAPQQPAANAQPAAQQPQQSVAQLQATQPQQATAPAQPVPQAATQPQVQAQQPQRVAQPQPQAQANTQQPQQPQQINTQPQATAPQSQIVNNPQAQTVQESWEGFSMSSLDEAHYDPADYWDEDPNWCYYSGSAKISDVDRELMAAERARRARGDYSGYPGKSKTVSNYKAKEGNPDNKFGASKKFWAEAKNGVINFEAFHDAYDAELKDEITMGEIFNDEGKLSSKGVYGKIKTFCGKKPESWAGKALKKLWALQFTDAGKPKEAPKVEKMEDKISHIIDKYEGSFSGDLEKDLRDLDVEVISDGFTHDPKTRERNPNCIWKAYGSNGTIDEEDQPTVKSLPYGNFVKSVYIRDNDKNQCLFYIFEKDGKYRVLPGQWELWLD